MRLCREHEKRRLKGVIGKVHVRDDPPTRGEHEVTVSRHQLGECFVVTAGNEPAKQLSVCGRRNKVCCGGNHTAKCRPSHAVSRFLTLSPVDVAGFSW